MNKNDANPIVFSYLNAHARVLQVVEDLTEEQFLRAAAPAVHPIAFCVWHLARWADHLRVHLPPMNADLARLLGEQRELWREEDLARRWGFVAGNLGYDETGMLMENAAAVALPFPSKAAVLEYAHRAFARADEVVGVLDERLLAGPNEPEMRKQSITNVFARVSVADAILAHVVHDNRHLGQIECLRGLMGLRGTATM
jgi:hypothetical protein